MTELVAPSQSEYRPDPVDLFLEADSDVGVLQSPEFQAVLVRYLRNIELALSTNEEWSLQHAGLAYWLVRIRMRTAEYESAFGAYVRPGNDQRLTADGMQPPSKEEWSDVGLLSEIDAEDRYPPYLRRKAWTSLRKTDLRSNASARVPKRRQRMSQLVCLTSVAAAVTVCLLAIGGQTLLLAIDTAASTYVDEPLAGVASMAPEQLTSQSAKEGLPSAVTLEATSKGKVYYDRVPAEQEVEPPALDEQNNSNSSLETSLMFGSDTAVAMLSSDRARTPGVQMPTGSGGNGASENEARDGLVPEGDDAEITAKSGAGQTDSEPVPVSGELRRISRTVTDKDEVSALPAAKQTEASRAEMGVVIVPPMKSAVTVAPNQEEMGALYTGLKELDTQLEQKKEAPVYHARMRAYSTRLMALEAYRTMVSRHHSTMQTVPWQIEPQKTDAGTVYTLILGPWPTWNEASRLCVKLVLLGESECSVKA